MQRIGLSFGKWLFFVHITKKLVKTTSINLFFRWLDQDTSSNIQSLYHDGDNFQEPAQDYGAIDDEEMWESISMVTSN